MSKIEESFVPVFEIPDEKYQRIQNLRNMFTSKYKRSPQFYVRVPGRVNLIGEHIDYCGYGVCPMALNQDIILAVGPLDGDSKLHLINVNPIYRDYEGDLKDFRIEVAGSPEWYQYFLCGVKGVTDILPEGTPRRGFQVVVDGCIPQSAGLSSSSALVSAAALATSKVHDLQITKEELSSLCAACERFIGTQGGGMDQAIAFLASEGCAKLIDFYPLKTKDVTLPSEAVFVIAHSLAELNKAATADFNCRVVECRLAAQIIAKKQRLNWRNIKTLGALQKELAFGLPDMISLVKRVLHEHPYGKEEILKELGTTPAELQDYSLTPNTADVQSFKLHQRSLHVFEEALRVQKFYEVCCESSEDTLNVLGQLMYESHNSLKDLYECSHPQLDKIVELSKGLCHGARLTGAGWGGCVVALLSLDNVETFIKLLENEYYKQLTVTDDLNNIVFVTSPNSGACIYLD